MEEDSEGDGIHRGKSVNKQGEWWQGECEEGVDGRREIIRIHVSSDTPSKVHTQYAPCFNTSNSYSSSPYSSQKYFTLHSRHIIHFLKNLHHNPRQHTSPHNWIPKRKLKKKVYYLVKARSNIGHLHCLVICPMRSSLYPPLPDVLLTSTSPVGSGSVFVQRSLVEEVGMRRSRGNEAHIARFEWHPDAYKPRTVGKPPERRVRPLESWVAAGHTMDGRILPRIEHGSMQIAINEIERRAMATYKRRPCAYIHEWNALMNT